MSDYVSVKKNEWLQELIQELLNNLDKFSEEEQKIIRRLRGRRFILESEFEKARELGRKL